jgi:hypothetical protein
LNFWTVDLSAGGGSDPDPRAAPPAAEDSSPTPPTSGKARSGNAPLRFLPAPIWSTSYPQEKVFLKQFLRNLKFVGK